MIILKEYQRIDEKYSMNLKFYIYIQWETRVKKVIMRTSAMTKRISDLRMPHEEV